MTTTPVKLTLAEYLTYDDGTDRRYELDEGNLILRPPATGQHELIARFLLTYLSQAIQQQGLDLITYSSGVEFLTSPRQPRRPDVGVISREQAQEIWRVSAILSTPPVLAVEVVSPESVKRDYQVKYREYAQAGVGEYWIIDPLQEKIMVLILQNGQYQEQEFRDQEVPKSQLFPAWQIPVNQILNPLGNSI